MARLEEAPLLGRSAELALLAKTTDEAAAGAGRSVFIVGEGGIGKTRLATAAAERATKRGWSVAVGRAYPVETGVPYALFADALLPLVRKLDPATMTVLTRGGAADFAQLFPNLGTTAERDRALVGADPAEVKARLLWSFTQFLGRLSAKQPLFMVLENLQWADASSLELLHFVARQIDGQKIILLGTYNEAERDSNAVLRSTEQSLLRLGSLTVHKLAPLGQPDVEDIVHQTFGVDKNATRHFSALLYDRTRGNPFFVEETLKSLVDSGALAQIEGRWTGWEMETLQLPSTIRDVVKARIDRLSPNARTLANLAAVIGTRAPYDTLARVSLLPEADIVAALDELRAQRVLEETGSVDAIHYDFTHPLLQQVIYSELGQARARMLHATIAEALEALYGDSALAHADELALHFARARSQPLAQKAVRYLHAAGRSALEKYANREAANYLAAALEHLDKDPAIDDAGREEILSTLARTRQRLGEYEAAMGLWERARNEAVARGERGALADIEHRMGLACYWSGKYADALAHYEAGLAEAEDGDPANTVRLRLAKGIALQDLGRLKEAQVEVEEALAAAAATGADKDALLSRAHRALLLLYTWTGPLGLAHEHGMQAIARAEAAGQRMLAAAIDLAIRTGDLEEANKTAGSVAHDLNNLLTVIQINTEFLLESAGENSASAMELAEIQGAARRASILARRLLASSRLEPFDVALAEAALRKKSSRTKGESTASEPEEKAVRAAETILLVDDEAAVRTLAKKVLSRKGYRVFEAADGAIALRVAAAHVGEIDLVLTDVAMPNLGGRGMVEELKELSPAIRVLFMSGYPREEIFPEKGSAARIPYLQKPFTSETLFSEVRSALGYAK